MRDADGGTNYVCFYDANGNLGQLIDRSDGSVDAKYEYDAYGNNLLDASDPNESGPYADDNPIRFSTKYFDDETGLSYFGFHYYSPRLGRWLSRDPIEEDGGYNVQVYVGDQPVLRFDSLGRDWEPIFEPQLPGPDTSVPAVTLKSDCGPEIGSALAGALADARANFPNNPKVAKRACEFFEMNSASGWEIRELALHGRGPNGYKPFRKPGCATGTCTGTVQIWGKCYLANEVNYVLWGLYGRLCDSSLWWQEDKVAIWRRWFGDPRGGPSGPGRTSCRQLFTRIGYKGGASVTNMGDATDCAVRGCGTECCKTPYQGTLSGYLGEGQIIPF